MSARVLPWAVAILGLSACEDRDPMQVQARDNAYSEDPYFDDARAMRPKVPGTVAQDWYRQQNPYVPLGAPDGGLAEPSRFPLQLTREVLLTGRSNFETWCAPCHGLLADGHSIVAENMRLRPPPALYGPLHTPHPPRSAVEMDGGFAEGAEVDGALAMIQRPGAGDGGLELPRSTGAVGGASAMQQLPGPGDGGLDLPRSTGAVGGASALPRRPGGEGGLATARRPDAGREAAGPLPPGWDALPHPPGYYYQVISGGYGLMPSYAAELRPEERWAVVAWLRVLAYSQRAPLSAAPPEVRASLEQQSGTGGSP